jgi:hypothetical protein
MLALACAVAIPATLALGLRLELDRRVEPRLSAVFGSPVSVSWADITLTGGLRLNDLRVGDVVSLGAVELYPDFAALPKPRLLEVRLEKPRWHLRPQGAPRLAPPRGSSDWKKLLPQRLIVKDGDLAVDLGHGGELLAKGIAIAPHAGGLRVVSHALSGRLVAGPWWAQAHFGRFAVDLSWPELLIERAVAANGTLSVLAGQQSIALENAVLAHHLPDAEKTVLWGSFERGSLRAELEAESILGVEFSAVPLALFRAFLPSWVVAENASVSGRATLDLNAQTLSASGHVRELMLSHPHLAAEALRMTLSLDFAGAWQETETATELLFERLQIAFRGARASMAGKIAWQSKPMILERLDVKVALEDTDCAGVFWAVPEALKRDLAGLELAGKLDAKVSIAYRRDQPESTRLAVDLDRRACEVLSEPFEADARCALPAGKRPSGCGDISPHTRRYVTLQGLPAYVSRAFVVAEDGNFFSHQGFDLDQIASSLAENLGASRLVRGGSTISQQVSKNLFLSRERTLARKIQEVILTWRLEHHLTKAEILEQYINLVQLSESAFGIAAGAEYWFGKETEALLPEEVAFLAALLPAPSTYAKAIRKEGGLPADLRERKDTILERLHKNGTITAGERERAKKSRLEFRVTALKDRLNADEDAPL